MYYMVQHGVVLHFTVIIINGAATVQIRAITRD